MTQTVVAFDLYGTILSTASIAGKLESLYGKDKAHSIASLARRYQLEYTWRANSMGKLGSLPRHPLNGADSVQRHVSLI